jgi:hypothetical protein
MEQIAGAVVGGLLGGGSSGGGTVSQDRNPWGPAQPWLQNLINQGQGLQSQYAANPFSQAQQTAYSNQNALSDAYRSMLPDLLKSIGNAGSFDRTNPLARPAGYNFNLTPQFQRIGAFAPGVMQTAIKQPVAQTYAPVQVDNSGVSNNPT